MDSQTNAREIEIIEYDAVAGKQKLRAVCRLAKDGSIGIEGDQKMVDRLNAGFYSPKTAGRVTPTDGHDYLDAVMLEFKNPHLLARKKQS